MANTQDLVGKGGGKIYLYTGLGKNAPITFTIRDVDGAIVDISSWDVRLVVNSNLDDSGDVVAELTGAFVTDGTDGNIRFNFDTVDITSIQKDVYVVVSRRIDANTQYTHKQFTTDVVLHGQ